LAYLKRRKWWAFVKYLQQEEPSSTDKWSQHVIMSCEPIITPERHISKSRRHNSGSARHNGMSPGHIIMSRRHSIMCLGHIIMPANPIFVFPRHINRCGRHKRMSATHNGARGGHNEAFSPENNPTGISFYLSVDFARGRLKNNAIAS
jgi:hypothetical protein